VASELPLPKDRNLYLPRKVDQTSMNTLTKSILEINQNDEHLKRLYGVYDLDYKPKPIVLYIDSYGGLVYQCFGLLGVMEKSETPIHTVATGAAMSCAFMILICGHKRFAYELATPLYHQISGGLFGKVQDMEESLGETKRLQETMEELVLEKTQITKRKLQTILKNKTDWYMTAAEALKLGVIDEIL